MKYENVKNDPAIKAYIMAADQSLTALGYTEHSLAHVTLVAERAGKILSELEYPESQVELAKIAGYLHDIGNLVNRVEHSQSSGIIAFYLLDKMGFPPEEIAVVSSAIGNHDEGTGSPVNAIAAALILADKSDVRRTRVRTPQGEEFDIHDRVNFSVTESDLTVCKESGEIRLSLSSDSEISSVMDYFEIFLQRMILCRKAAEKLGMEFKLFVNGQELL